MTPRGSLSRGAYRVMVVVVVILASALAGYVARHVEVTVRWTGGPP